MTYAMHFTHRRHTKYFLPDFIKKNMNNNIFVIKRKYNAIKFQFNATEKNCENDVDLLSFYDSFCAIKKLLIFGMLVLVWIWM